MQGNWRLLEVKQFPYVQETEKVYWGILALQHLLVVQHMSQPYVCIYTLPLGPPFHVPPAPSHPSSSPSSAELGSLGHMIAFHYPSI